jgi:hypothetical protein
MFTRLCILALLCNVLYAGSNYTSPPSKSGSSKSQKQSAATVKEKDTSDACYNNDYFVSVDFLYWFVKQEGNNYAATGVAITVPGTTDPTTGLNAPTIASTGKVYAPNSDMQPGVKVGFGMNFEDEQKYIFGEYTYIRGKANGSVQSTDANAGILPIFSYTPNNSILSQTTYASAPSAGSGIVSAADTNWAVNFNNLTVEIGREISILPKLVLYPHFGLQASFQKQRFYANYTVWGQTFNGNQGVIGNNQVFFHQKFWGIGPRVCLDTVWKFCDHVSFFANSALAALWGQFRAHAYSYDTNNNPNSTSSNYSQILIGNQVNHFHTLSPLVQLALGLEFDWTLENQNRIVADIGWETQVWFFQNQHSSTIADTSLILEGLTISVGLDF